MKNIKRVQLHCHTTRSDGTSKPQTVIENYRKSDFDVLCITDHDVEPKREPKIYEDLIVLWGTELSPDEEVGQHVNLIYAHDEELRILNHPQRYDNSLDEVMDLMRTHKLDGLECTNHGEPDVKYERFAEGPSPVAVPSLARYGRMPPFPVYATDDAHTISGISDGYVLVECESDDPVDILKSLKDPQKIVNEGCEYRTEHLLQTNMDVVGGWLQVIMKVLWHTIKNYARGGWRYIMHWINGISHT